MGGDRADGPWDMADPRRDRSAIPYTDADTEALIDELIDTLVIFRCPMGLGDTGPTISALASLEAEIALRLPDAVADARDQGYTWQEIAARLATTASAARQRHAAYTRSRRELLRAAAGFVTSDTRVPDVEPTIGKQENPAGPPSHRHQRRADSSQHC